MWINRYHVIGKRLTLMLLVANLANTKWFKKPENDWNPGTWYSAKAIQWIPTWQGLDGFQKPLRPCGLDESSLNIERVNVIKRYDPISNSQVPNKW